MWEAIKAIEYYLGLVVFIGFCILFIFCQIMANGLISIDTLDYIDWSGAVNSLSKAGAPILILAYVIQSRKKKKPVAVESARQPSKEEIIRKAPKNAESFNEN